MTPAIEPTEANLRELRREYVDARRYARRMVSIIRKGRTRGIGSDLADLLKHDSEWKRGIVPDAETWYRDGMDYVLGYLSVVEIGSATGHCPARLPPELETEALDILRNPAVREYYESSYALALPVALLRRLEAEPFAKAGSLEDEGTFPDFLDITHPIENDDDLESFLWLLDGGARYDEDEEDWIDIDSTRDVLGDQERFLEMVGSRGREPLARSVRGFGKFVEFCRSLDRLLRRKALPSLLRAYYWHYHEYWFGQLAHHLEREVGKGLDAFEAWEDQGSWTRRRYDVDRRETKAAIRRLTSGRYGAALTRRLPADVRRELAR